MLERERKFKLKYMPEGLGNGTSIRQAYLMLEDGKQLRVRLANTDGSTVAHICYKANVEGSATDKHEYEYQIPAEDGLELFNSTDLRLTKQRYKSSFGQCQVDIDVYPGGLSVVEIEMPEGVELNSLPDYCGEEVTGQKEYSNIALAIKNLPLLPD